MRRVIRWVIPVTLFINELGHPNQFVIGIKYRHAEHTARSIFSLLIGFSSRISIRMFI